MNKIKMIVLTAFVVTTLNSCSDRGFEEDGMIFIPASEFTRGTNDEVSEESVKEMGLRKKQWYGDARPVKKIHLSGYFIDKYETTNEEYYNFTSRTDYRIPTNWDSSTKKYPEGLEKHPVNNVSWHDAYSYCLWSNKELPTEEQWEKAAKGPEDNKYSWGNEWDETKGNLDGGKTSEVGSFKEDKSYYGLYDMTGNVGEWTKSYYKAYEGNTERLIDYGNKHRVIKGGSAFNIGHYILTPVMSANSYRLYYLPGGAGDDGGFRCAKNLSQEKEEGAKPVEPNYDALKKNLNVSK